MTVRLFYFYCHNRADLWIKVVWGIVTYVVNDDNDVGLTIAKGRLWD